MATKFINLTGRPITTKDGLILEPENVRICANNKVQISKSYVNGSELGEASHGEIKNLPDPQQGTYYIVPWYIAPLVLARQPERTDIVVIKGKMALAGTQRIMAEAELLIYRP